MKYLIALILIVACSLSASCGRKGELEAPAFQDAMENG